MKSSNRQKKLGTFLLLAKPTPNKLHYFSILHVPEEWGKFQSNRRLLNSIENNSTPIKNQNTRLKLFTLNIKLIGTELKRKSRKHKVPSEARERVKIEIKDKIQSQAREITQKKINNNI